MFRDIWIQLTAKVAGFMPVNVGFMIFLRVFLGL
jgi:hypothetical protein